MCQGKDLFHPIGVKSGHPVNPSVPHPLCWWWAAIWGRGQGSEVSRGSIPQHNFAAVQEDSASLLRALMQSRACALTSLSYLLVDPLI